MLALLVPLVLAAHLWLADRLWLASLDWGAAPPAPTRIDVAFVRELLPTVPPAPPPPTRRAAAPRAAGPAPAASAPAEAPAASEPAAAMAAPEVASAVADAAAAASEPAVDGAAAGAPEAAASAAAAAPVFEWPPSTRLSYRLTGQYRGPVEGQARVEWLARGTRYQVHLEVSVGPAFAPLMSRRMSSDGEITAAGLVPRRYDEETLVALRAPRRLAIEFDGEQIRLPGGQVAAQPAGVQDTASQFVQMTWMFTLRPELLHPGAAIELPLALPRRLLAWTYDVVGPERLATAVGEVEAVRVRPRLPPRRGAELTAEFWVAPTLQYLPVRILIRQDDESYVDLTLDRLPQQAER